MVALPTHTTFASHRSRKTTRRVEMPTIDLLYLNPTTHQPMNQNVTLFECPLPAILSWRGGFAASAASAAPLLVLLLGLPPLPPRAPRAPPRPRPRPPPPRREPVLPRTWPRRLACVEVGNKDSWRARIYVCTHGVQSALKLAMKWAVRPQTKSQKKYNTLSPA